MDLFGNFLPRRSVPGGNVLGGNMNILDIIQKKRDNIELNNEEIKYFINGYTDGSVSDYQAAALIMAIFINGMTE